MAASGERTAAVIGAGTIGLSWATLFSASGYSVRVTDPRPDLAETVRQTVRQFAATLPGGSRDADELLSRIEVVGDDLEAAVAGADVVQENGPERIDLKRELFRRVEAAAPPEALLLSSTSGLMPSDMSAEMTEPGRLLVGHPFNPPHVLPLVEVVPGPQADPRVVERAVEFYRGLGKDPVVLRKEIGGFVANRLQSAIFRECVHLVQEGVVTPDELDTVVRQSIGARWATMGPFESYHLGGGPGGIRHLFEHLGPGMRRRWKSLGEPELTEELVDELSTATEQRFAGSTYEERTERRDRLQLAVLAARDAVDVAGTPSDAAGAPSDAAGAPSGAASGSAPADGAPGSAAADGAPGSSPTEGAPGAGAGDAPPATGQAPVGAGTPPGAAGTRGGQALGGSGTLPALPGDFYGYEAELAPDEQEVVLRLREFLDREVRPIANEYWAKAEFPHHIRPGLAELGIVGLGYGRPGRPPASRLLSSFLTMELSRVDTSIATFFGVHTGLAMGSIVLCGSEEQKERWLPDMFTMDTIGAFGLTEPHGGSDVARGLDTTCRRTGDTWVLNGAKRWIGNATFADLVIIWARDVDDDQVKGFVVEKGTPGFTATKMEHKLALRTVQNADITLSDCEVPEANRLQNANSFRDTGKVLRLTRGGVAWNAVGCMMGAYEVAVDYAKTREQFGRPIGKFQMVQEHLVTMLGNITSSLSMTVRVSQLQERGVCTDEQAAMAKLFATQRLRETVARGREVFGGNGVLLDYDAPRFFNDAEALYSYEGTREMNTLIVGRSITGMGAFV